MGTIDRSTVQTIAPATERAAEMMKMLGCPVRLQILTLLKESDKCVQELADELNMNHPAVSHHLSLLLRWKLLKKRRVAKNMYYSLSNEKMMFVVDFLLSQF